MKQVMRNILDNAIKYSPNGCHVAGLAWAFPSRTPSSRRTVDGFEPPLKIWQK